MKRKFIYSIVLLPLILIIIIFTISIIEVTENKNVGFDSEYIFTKVGYESIPSKVKELQDEYSKYISDNQDRFDAYDSKRFNKSLEDYNKSNYNTMLSFINENLSESKDKKIFIEDLEVVIKSIVLNMNIQMYNMSIEPIEAEERSEYRNKVENMEKLYWLVGNIKANIDSVDGISLKENKFYINMEEKSFEIANTDGEKGKYFEEEYNNTKETIKEINIVAIVVVIIIMIIVVIYHNYKGVSKKRIYIVIGLLSLYLVFILIATSGYKMFYKSYNPVYKSLNKNFGVILKEDGYYYLDFKPILVVDEFQNRGGELPLQEDLKDEESYKQWLNQTPPFYTLDVNGNKVIIDNEGNEIKTDGDGNYIKEDANGNVTNISKDEYDKLGIEDNYKRYPLEDNGKLSTNADVLEDIVDEIEAGGIVDDGKHPGFGGLNMN